MTSFLRFEEATREPLLVAFLEPAAAVEGFLRRLLGLVLFIFELLFMLVLLLLLYSDIESIASGE